MNPLLLAIPLGAYLLTRPRGVASDVNALVQAALSPDCSLGTVLSTSCALALQGRFDLAALVAAQFEKRGPAQSTLAGVKEYLAGIRVTCNDVGYLESYASACDTASRLDLGRALRAKKAALVARA